MLKKFALLCLAVVSIGSLEAKTVPLQTGRWIFDRYRNVDIDHFDYSYTIQYTDQRQAALQLDDGSLWQVTAMNEETASFYAQKNPLATPSAAISLFSYWQQGDTLIFHKVVNRDTLLAYNVTRDMLLDLLPVAAPTNPSLKIASITNTNEITYTYRYNQKTDSVEQYQNNNWRTLIVLTDGSVWEGNPSRALLSWVVGDPIHIAKDTPWWSNNTHILMNFKPTKGSVYSTPDFRRLGVWRAG